MIYPDFYTSTIRSWRISHGSSQLKTSPAMRSSVSCSIYSKWTALVFSLFTLFAFSSAQDVDLTASLVAAGQGFRVLGAVADDLSGHAVSSAGDVNHDDVSDFIVGA